MRRALACLSALAVVAAGWAISSDDAASANSWRRRSRNCRSYCRRSYRTNRGTRYRPRRTYRSNTRYVRRSNKRSYRRYRYRRTPSKRTYAYRRSTTTYYYTPSKSTYTVKPSTTYTYSAPSVPYGTATQTPEAIPRWTRFDKIPYDRMWEDDQHWLPEMIAGRRFDAYFVFEESAMLSKRIDWR